MRDFNQGDDPNEWRQNLADWKQAEADAVAAQNAAQSAVQNAQQAVSSLTAWIGSRTPAEATAAAAYWATRRAGHADQAWADLVRRIGPQRAAWVVRATDPTGPAPAKTDRSWTALAPRAELLPDRFAVVAYASGQPVNVAPAGSPAQYVTWANAVQPDPLTIAALASPADPDWTTDFAKAEAAGMAVTIPVPAGAPPIDQLIAVGLRTGGGNLADLLDEQAYTAGVEILADGTATNNTGQARAGFNPAHDAQVAGGTADAPAAGSAGAQLAQLLGILPARLSRTTGAHTARAWPVLLVAVPSARISTPAV